MKKKKNVFSMGFLGKFVLLVALFVGGGMSAWAGDVLNISFVNNNLPNDWDNGGTYGGTTYNEFLTSNDGIYGKQTWSYSVLTSKNKIKMDLGQKIILSASLYPSGATYPYLELHYSSDGTTWTKLTQWTSFTFGTFDECSVTIDNNKFEDGCFLQIRVKKVLIKSLEILSALSELTIIDEGTDPGEFKSNTPSSLTVKYTANAGWNTICMPIQLKSYSVDHLSTIFGTGWKAYTLSGYENGVISFAQSGNIISANTPLLVYAPNATGSQTELNLTNEAVTYSASPSTTVDGATFQGTYAPMSMEGKYGVTSSGQVMQGTATADIKGYRAYFTGITPPAGGARPTIVFEDDEDTQGLSAVMWMENTKEAYNLQGQKVEKGRKGIYIVNGRKVIIK